MAIFPCLAFILLTTAASAFQARIGPSSALVSFPLHHQPLIWRTACRSDLSGWKNRFQLNDAIASPSSPNDLNTVNTNDENYQEFLELKQRRATVSKCSTFERFDAFEIDQIAHLLEKINFGKDEKVITQGDTGDAMFLVASGAFECYAEDNSSQVLRTCKVGDVFGELSLILSEPRALSVRASEPNSAVWKISKQNFLRFMTASRKSEVVAAFQQDEDYADYLDKRMRRAALVACPVFKNLEETDLSRLVESMKRLDIQAGDKIIQEGSKGDSMYFVVDGRFDCFREKTQEVVKVCRTGDYFGELALVFDKPRAISVAASQTSVAWQLDRESFLSSVQDSAISDQATELLKTAYKKKSPIESLGQLTFSDVYQLLVVKSRPKKQPVSMHSRACIFVFGVFLTALLPLFAPGKDVSGIPRIFDVTGHNSPITLRQMQASSWLMTITGLMGVLRIPPRAPPCRRILFQTAALLGLFLSVYVSSNLTGTPQGMFNAFSFPWNIILVASHSAVWASLLRLVDDALAGPKSGRGTIPLNGNRVSATISSLMMCILFSFFTCLVVPVFTSDLASYTTHVTSYVQQGFEGGQLSAFVTLQALAWLASFFATLQFEKKLSPVICSLLAGITVFLLNFDATAYALTTLFFPESVVGGTLVLKYFNSIVQTYRLNSVHFGVMSLAVLSAVRKLWIGRKKPDLRVG